MLSSPFTTDTAPAVYEHNTRGMHWLMGEVIAKRVKRHVDFEYRVDGEPWPVSEALYRLADQTFVALDRDGKVADTEAGRAWYRQTPDGGGSR